MNHQTMSGKAAQTLIDKEVQKYAVLIKDGQWTLSHAHQVLVSDALNLFEIAGLAKAIACFQCDPTCDDDIDPSAAAERAAEYGDYLRDCKRDDLATGGAA